jgi:O-6-methylguanine DNA methyltransferase
MELDTSWGSISIELENGKVLRCSLPYVEATPTRPFAIKSPCNTVVSSFIAAALEGTKMTVPALAKLDGTQFQRQVWKAISQIPKGQTRTYGEIASAIGRPRAIRAVANACGKNPVPLFIPCHRVVAANGKIGGFSAGLAWKRLLLQNEI